MALRAAASAATRRLAPAFRPSPGWRRASTCPPPRARFAPRRWRSAAAGAAGAALAGSLGFGAFVLADGKDAADAAAPRDQRRQGGGEWPAYTVDEVAQHKGEGGGPIWVTYRDGVYDITRFVEAHPGGAEKIMMAAGGAIDPFWALYQQHNDAKVLAVLKGLRCGTLRRDAAQQRAADAAAAARAASDPYGNEPARHPALVVLKHKPFNAEVPPGLLVDHYVTPTALWYVRHHHPVPDIDPAAFALEVVIENPAAAKAAAAAAAAAEAGGSGQQPDGPAAGGEGESGDESAEGAGAAPPPFLVVRIPLADLKGRFPKHTVTATMQCGGNRRGELNEVASTQGLLWSNGAISTATWGGVRVRDVLRAVGVDGPDAARARGLRHVQFIGWDEPYDASVPVAKAVGADGDVLLAYEMNGQPLSREHGAPLRAIVPGHIGARNVKWVKRVVASAEEAHSSWQRGVAYKFLGPTVKSFQGLDLTHVPSVQELPIQSAICVPRTDGTSAVVIGEDDEIEVKGYAWAGGGRGVQRVEVSIDGGRTFTTASLQQGRDQPPGKAWAWTLWEATIPLPDTFRAYARLNAEPLGGADAALRRTQSAQAKAAPGSGPVRTPLTLEIVCKATDTSCNSQPESLEGIWNLRGILNNAWHRVTVQVCVPGHDEDEDDDGENVAADGRGGCGE